MKLSRKNMIKREKGRKKLNKVYVISGKNIKVAKIMPKSSLTAIDVLYLIILHIDSNVKQEFQPFMGAEKSGFPKKKFL